MLKTKFYIPIGLCILVIVAIGFFSLRSDVSTEPIKIYKTVDIEVSTTSLDADKTLEVLNAMSVETEAPAEPETHPNTTFHPHDLMSDEEHEAFHRREREKRRKELDKTRRELKQLQTLLEEKDAFETLRVEAEAQMPALNAATNKIQAQMDEFDDWMVLENLPPTEIRKRYSKAEIDAFYENLLKYADLGDALVGTYFSYPDVVMYERIAFPEKFEVWERDVVQLKALKVRADEMRKHSFTTRK